MNYIKLFEAFVQSLNEIGFSGHWIERTDLRDTSLSRVVPRSRNQMWGWTLVNFLDERRNPIEKEIVIPQLNIGEEQLNYLISRSLFQLTRSQRLRDWFPQNRDKTYQMMNLGRVAIWNGQNYFYPVLRAGNPKGEVYSSGDNVWGFTKDDLMGSTIKYYPSNDQGQTDMYNSSLADSKLSRAEFYRLSEISNPYGGNFRVIIDLTDPNLDSVQRKLVAQVEGREWSLGPEEERVGINYERPKKARKTLSVGMDIGFIIPFINREEFTIGKITEIKNIQQIKDLRKFDNLSDLEILEIGFIPNDPGLRKLKSDGTPIEFIVKLKPESALSIDGTAYRIPKEKPMVTSEPSIINQGNVQIWAE